VHNLDYNRNLFLCCTLDNRPEIERGSDPVIDSTNSLISEDQLRDKVRSPFSLMTQLLMQPQRSSEITADFNNDGFEDKAIGVPGEDLVDNVNGDQRNAGVVQVIYGSKVGLEAGGLDSILPDQLLHQGVSVGTGWITGMTIKLSLSIK
jgi:hypothetical protein